MIKQILEKDFMLKSADTLKRSMAHTIENSEKSTEIKQLLIDAEIETNDLREAEAELQKSIERETQRSSHKEDNASYFARDAVMSLAQSALQEFCETKKPGEIVQKTDEKRGVGNNG